ncbi:hypothetical protein S1OALGB6SA_450 [Olavius algarvensis spirochete endosymbiont]|nr:hypothetical protein [Olavius algarvensis spirochete endosymbiont]CAD7843512.1 MAG: hypothetical protein [Olavius algarvensis spirochete endosymbiont]VDA99382.1 hypothetical protein S1OALGB6SA_450 [Olavius algarvensis spirochete endosymbiont]
MIIKIFKVGKYRISLPDDGEGETTTPRAGFRVSSMRKMNLRDYWDGRL